MFGLRVSVSLIGVPRQFGKTALVVAKERRHKEIAALLAAEAANPGQAAKQAMRLTSATGWVWAAAD